MLYIESYWKNRDSLDHKKHANPLIDSILINGYYCYNKYSTNNRYLRIKPVLFTHQIKGSIKYQISDFLDYPPYYCLIPNRPLTLTFKKFNKTIILQPERTYGFFSKETFLRYFKLKT